MARERKPVRRKKYSFIFWFRGRPPAELSVDAVLDYPSMKGVAERLNEPLYLHLKGSDETTGLDIVRLILRDYDPRRANKLTEQYLARIFSLYSLAEGNLPLDDDSRTFLANVAHAIWVESKVSVPPTPPPALFRVARSISRYRATSPLASFLEVVARLVTVRLPTLRDVAISWSLRDRTRQQVDSHLLGRIHDSNANDIKYYYQFKFYNIARGIMLKMRAWYKGVKVVECKEAEDGLLLEDIEASEATAVARFVEYAGDNFMHYKHGPYMDQSEYASRLMHDGDGDKDLSETFQRRIGGCGAPSFVSVLLARAMNIPATVAHPSCSDGRDGHRSAFFPTVDSWVHGDHVADYFGALGEPLLMSTEEISQLTSLEYYNTMSANGQAARNAMKKAFGIDFGFAALFRSAEASRSFHADYTNTNSLGLCGRIITENRFSARGYLLSRLGYLKLQVDDSAFSIAPQKYSLLDCVAAHWPMDGRRHEAGRAYEATLWGAHGTLPDTSTVQAVTEEGIAFLRFSGGEGIQVDDVPSLRRNTEELTVAAWLRLGAESGGTVLERKAVEDESIVYSVQVVAGDGIRFAWTPAGGSEVLTATSKSPLARIFHQ